MTADQIREWAREADEYARGEMLRLYPDAPSTHVKGSPYFDEYRDAHFARLVAAAAFEEAKERISELRRGCSLCEGQYLHDQCDSIGDEVTHEDYIDVIEALAAAEKEPR